MIEWKRKSCHAHLLNYMPNTLYYGDNLKVLREHVADESVDLTYLDPPFNSNASYNVLFREKSGEDSPAQIKAFTDTWEWASNPGVSPPPLTLLQVQAAQDGGISKDGGRDFDFYAIVALGGLG